MTKTQVKNKINALIRNSQKELVAKVNAVLVQADMWYGYDDNAPGEEAREWIVNSRNRNDRNGDQFVHEGVFKTGTGDDINNWLHTREELGL